MASRCPRARDARPGRQRGRPARPGRLGSPPPGARLTSDPRGKDPHKKVYSRKRHLVFDTLGMVVAAVVHAADIQDRGGAKLVLKEILCKSPRLKKCMADGIDNGGGAEWAREVGGWILELVVRLEGQRKFEVLSWRRIAERKIRLVGAVLLLEQGLRAASGVERVVDLHRQTHFMPRRLEPV
ncbi:MAG TPA: transposase [Isosphaeraceae bacterium]|nr:transposase [Isosphaeraceae bacterium]